MVQLAGVLGIDRQRLLARPDAEPATVVPLFDVAVLSSRSEAMSNAILEYTAAGIATVATDVGGTREVLQDGQTALLVPARNPDALAEGVCQLLADPTLRRSLGDNARHSAQTLFTEPRATGAYAELYFRLAGLAGAAEPATQSPLPAAYRRKPAEQ